jgi:hypothetical protein
VRKIGWVLASCSLVAVAACGQAASATTVVRSSATKTAQAKTSKFALDVTSQTGGSNVEVKGDGVADFAKKDIDLTMDIPQAGSIEVLTFGTVAYVKLPRVLQSQIPGGKPYGKIDLQAVGRSKGLDFSSLTSGSSDPTSGLSYLNGAADGVTKVGTETLRGAKTTHYKATVDLQKAEAKATAAQKQTIEKARTQLGTSTFPVDVWIDSAGRVRKMSYSFDLSKVKSASGQSAGVGQTTATIEFYDYGTPVNLTEPPADQVTDLTQQATGTH